MLRDKIKKVLCVGLMSLGMISVANATFSSRLGGLAIYDSDLDITWLVDGNFAATSGFNITGNAPWADANTWAAGLTIGGVNGWRLASMDVNGDGVVVDCSGGGVIGCADNEMGYLFWEEGITSSAPGPFSILPGANWSATEDASNLSDAWLFNFFNGAQGTLGKGFGVSGWVIHSGDVSAVPIPAAMWLFGSGLIGLLGFKRRKS